MIPITRISRPAVALLLGLAMAAGCSSSSDLTGADDHPVPGGSWLPTTGDHWPGWADALELRGCVAYGGVPVSTDIQHFAVVGVRSVSNLDDGGFPFIVIDPTVLMEPERTRRFLYFHECAHNLLQHPALRVIDDAPDAAVMEYDANCHAAAHLLRSELYSRQDIDFMLLFLANNRGPDRPPFQSEQLLQCLQEQGLY